MPLIHKKPKTRGAFNPLLADPTKTTTLRRVFSQALRGRLKILAQRVNHTIVNENALGIRPTQNLEEHFEIEYTTDKDGQTYLSGFKSNLMVESSSELVLMFNSRWSFNTTSEQVKAFLSWFLEQCQELLYQQEENSWWREYVQKAYQQGAGATWAKWRDKTKFLQEAFNNPVQIERVKTLAGRVLTELKNVSQAMATQMSRSLVDGLAQGKSPRDVAKDLTATVSGLGENRANAIAQTEIIRGHSEGQLDSLENLGMDQVGIQVEWSTSHLGKTKVTGSKKKGTLRGGNPSPCNLCKPMEGTVFTIQEARGLIPRHVNCHCSWLPAGVSEDTSGQKIGKRPINDALRQSIKAEIPAASKTTLAQQMSRTKWVGADRIGKISGKPPGTLNFNPNHDELGRFSEVSSKASGEDAHLWETSGQRHLPTLRPGQMVAPPIKQSEVGEETPFHVRKKGVGGDEIYNPLPTTKIKVDSLKTMQPIVEEPRLKVWDQSKAEPIHVMVWKGQPYITQGNHRAASAWAAGVHEIEAKVLDLDQPNNWKYLQPKIKKVLAANFNPNHDKEGKFSSVPSSVMSDFNKMMDIAMIQAKPPEKPATMKIYEAMSHIESGADMGALVSMKDLRKHTGIPKEKFDKAVIELHRAKLVMPHYHDFATSLSPTELAELVDSGTDQHPNAGRYWVGIAKRRGTTNSESVMLSLAKKDNQ